MIGMNFIVEIVETVVFTGRVLTDREGAVKGETPQIYPVSIFVVGPPENGKTTVTNKVSEGAPVAILTDVTSSGIIRLCRERQDVTHLLINDMMAVVGHRQAVTSLTMSYLSAMMEEGLKQIAMGGSVEVFTRSQGRRGLIACMTPQMVHDGRNWWNKMGITSRVIPINFNHSPQLQRAVKDAIDRDYRANIKRAKYPPKPKFIPIPAKEIREIRLIADAKSETFKEAGYRRLYQYRALARAHALRRGGRAVNQKDVDFLAKMQQYVNYNTGKEVTQL